MMRVGEAMQCGVDVVDDDIERRLLAGLAEYQQVLSESWKGTSIWSGRAWIP
jgi:hypothetical protein